ncbi:unnamed protein product [Dracunculus medinensis]|uniref:Ribosome biogenesis protein RPF2 homolog n=1 Tax=Dracunculus medinensis TaxID=318479 RepID=A0A0N4UNY5_DRAME|nr:unnamed protein product [Dracunculus medinensis]
MALKKVAYGAVSNNDVSYSNKTIEDLRSVFIIEKYEKQQDLIMHLTRSVEILTKKEKEPCLVGINIPEKSTDDESATADMLLAENIVVVAGFKTEFIKEVRRHGRKGTGRPRVLKIRLEDKQMAISVLRNKDVRSIVLFPLEVPLEVFPLEFPLGNFLRKDLTKRELLLDK